MEEAKCEFEEHWWNDPEQRNYLLCKCNNPENKGGAGSTIGDDGHSLKHNYHDERTYSCWYHNKGMAFRCWGDKEKMKQCPLSKLLN
jgi:hypothetical protein